MWGWCECCESWTPKGDTHACSHCQAGLTSGPPELMAAKPRSGPEGFFALR